MPSGSRGSESLVQRSATLSSVQKGQLCAGCGLCQAIATPGKIDMELSSEGYLRPHQRQALTDAEDRLISETCPGLRLDQESAQEGDHSVWGPIIKVRKGYSTDPALRYRASSGGALSAILVYLLDSKSIDYVVQTSASIDSPMLNSISKSTGRDHVFHASGSRYSPSAPLRDLDEQLNHPGRFAFVGKPCDVAAVRALARHDKRVEAKIPYLISFFCAGIPSLDGTKAILAELGVEESDLIKFRFRGDGWPGSATATTRDQRQWKMSYDDAWGGILSKHLQFRCKICPDGSGSFADIVCADAWECDESGYPLFEELDGWSLVVTRTAKGEDLLRRVSDAGHVNLTDLDVSEIVRMQPYQGLRKQLVLSRLVAMRIFGRVVPRYRGFHLLRAAVAAGWWPNLRSFLGLIRRIVIRRL